MLSTCNRTILWTHGNLFPAELLRSERGAAGFFCLSGEAAIRHLYEVAAGLLSQVPLEEQILGQLRKALDIARSSGSCGAILNHLFLSAISAGKEVRAKLQGERRTGSVAQLAVDRAQLEAGLLRNKKALVIGSGETGMLCARLLLECGARVAMTRRKPRNDGVCAPAGAELTPYEARYQVLRGCEVVISATACPGTVLRKEGFEPAYGNLIIFDLAVPRDVEPSLGQICGVKLFDVDSLGHCRFEEAVSPVIGKILERYRERFYEWALFRGCKPFFEDIHSFFDRELSTRLQRAEDGEIIRAAARRAADKLLFTLKDKAGIEKAVELYTILAEAARG